MPTGFLSCCIYNHFSPNYKIQLVEDHLQNILTFDPGITRDKHVQWLGWQWT